MDGQVLGVGDDCDAWGGGEVVRPRAAAGLLRCFSLVMTVGLAAFESQSALGWCGARSQLRAWRRRRRERLTGTAAMAER